MTTSTALAAAARARKDGTTRTTRTTPTEEDGMSTLPGKDAWRDAGIEPVEQEVPASIVDDEDEDVRQEPDPEEYTPGFPRGDRDGQAAEADVVEQAIEVPVDDDSDDRA